MKAMTLIAALLLLTTTTFAGTLKLSGMGVDDKPCSAEISYNEANQLTDVKLDGATKDFEIIAETSKGYGPKSSISPRGASEILSMFQEEKELYKKMTYRWSYLKGADVYRLTVADLKKDAPAGKDDEDLKFIGGKFEIELHYDNEGNLVKVEAVNDFRTLKIIKLGSKKFTCALVP